MPSNSSNNSNDVENDNENAADIDNDGQSYHSRKMRSQKEFDDYLDEKRSVVLLAIILSAVFLNS